MQKAIIWGNRVKDPFWSLNTIQACNWNNITRQLIKKYLELGELFSFTVETITVICFPHDWKNAGKASRLSNLYLRIVPKPNAKDFVPHPNYVTSDWNIKHTIGYEQKAINALLC